MTWPTSASKTNTDQGTDDPKQALLTDLVALVDKVNQIISHVTSFAQTLLDDTTAGAARTTLGLGTVAVKNTGTSGDAVPLLDQTANFSGQFLLSGTISPTQIAADVNDYSPSGISGASTLRLNSDAERTITGLSGGAAGRLVTLINVGSNNIILAHQSASSTAANRFLFSAAADLTLEAEQSVTLRYDGTSSRWRRVQEVAAVSGSAMAFIESQDLSAAASADFTGFNASTYDSYVFELMNVVPATDTVRLYLRTSTDGGTSYDSGAADYAWVFQGATMTTTLTDLDSGDEQDTQINLQSTSGSTAGTVGSGAGEDGVSGQVVVHGPHLAKRTSVTGSVTWQNSAGDESAGSIYGLRNSSADVDAIQFLFSSGNIESGTITMYGMKNS